VPNNQIAIAARPGTIAIAVNEQPTAIAHRAADALRAAVSAVTPGGRIEGHFGHLLALKLRARFSLPAVAARRFRCFPRASPESTARQVRPDSRGEASQRRPEPLTGRNAPANPSLPPKTAARLWSKATGGRTLRRASRRSFFEGSGSAAGHYPGIASVVTSILR